MRPWRQGKWWPVAFVAGGLLISPLPAQNPPKVPAPGSVPATSPLVSAHKQSPVDLFRQLLTMTPEERTVFLTNRPPEYRTRILAKVGEYEALSPNERELRLRATELRWYLMPLLRGSPTNRAVQWAAIPGDLRVLIQDRLAEWNLLPPSLQQEFLENERTLHYFAHLDMSNSAAEDSGPAPTPAERTRWDALSEAERRQVTTGFNHFFELSHDEKQAALNTLSEAERRQMGKTLQSFDQMPAWQRAECVSAFAKFASLTAPEKTEFLKNAEHWSAMSPAERQAWRDLVVNVPQWPPLPEGFVAPIPGEAKPGAAANHD